jgi:hypothetical protein
MAAAPLFAFEAAAWDSCVPMCVELVEARARRSFAALQPPAL